VAAPPESPLAACPIPVLVVVLHMEVGGEGYACAPSESPREFDWCGPELNASPVVWWRGAAGIGEAVKRALQCV
jgi:hypothetical protein